MFEKKLTGYASNDKPQNKGAKFWEAHPIIPDINIYTAIKVISSFYRDEKAVDCLKLSATYQQLLDDAVTVSMALKELGVKKGDIITVSMPNFYQAVAVFMAANRIGATTTFLNSFAPDEEIVSYLNLFESPIYINFNRSDEENQKIVDKTHVRYVITLDKSKVNSLSLNGNYHLTKSNTIDFNSLGCLAKFQKKTLENPFNALDDALILYTSGTTGKPKAVVLTNKNILASGIYMKNSTNLENTKGEKSLVCVPFTYPYGFATSTLMSLMCGRTAVLAPDLSKDNINYYLSKKPNIIFGSPALLELIKKNITSNADLSSLTTFISGGDTLSPAKNEEGVKFFQADKFNNEGIIEEKKIGEEGLLCIGGEHVFKEYYKMPEKTLDAKVMYKGKEYVRVGSTGFIDNDGYYHLKGRDSRYYIISTLNKVYCDRIQLLMSSIDVIDSVAVVKKKDNDKLYTAKAYVVLKNGVQPSEEIKNHILEECKKPLTIYGTDEVSQLNDYEIPESIDFVPFIPKTKADKVDYTTLEEFAWQEAVSQHKRLALKLD